MRVTTQTFFIASMQQKYVALLMLFLFICDHIIMKIVGRQCKHIIQTTTSTKSGFN